MHRLALFGAAALCAAALCATALLRPCEAAAVSPLEYTKQTLEKTRVIVDSEVPHNQKLVELSKLLATFLDTDTMGKAALGNNAAKFSAAQQKEFYVLFRELFQRTYVQKLLFFERPNFAYVGEQLDGKTARVDTKILTPRDEFLVVYQMRAEGDHWLATDIKIEDLSLTANFRSQLSHLLSTSSPEDVLERMRKKYGPAGTGGGEDSTS